MDPTPDGGKSPRRTAATIRAWLMASAPIVAVVIELVFNRRP